MEWEPICLVPERQQTSVLEQLPNNRDDSGKTASPNALDNTSLKASDNISVKMSTATSSPDCNMNLEHPGQVQNAQIREEVKMHFGPNRDAGFQIPPPSFSPATVVSSAMLMNSEPFSLVAENNFKENVSNKTGHVDDSLEISDIQQCSRHHHVSGEPVTSDSPAHPNSAHALDNENMAGEDPTISSDTHDTRCSNQIQNPNPTSGSILQHARNTSTVIDLSSFERSIIIRRGDTLVKVANLACIDNNFNIAFITDLVGDNSSTKSDSNKLNENLSLASSRPLPSVDSSQGITERSVDCVQPTLSDVLPVANVQQTCKLSLKANEQTQSTKVVTAQIRTISPHSQPNMPVQCFPCNSSEPGRISNALTPQATHQPQKITFAKVLNASQQNRLSAKPTHPKTCPETVDMDTDDTSYAKLQSSNYVNFEPIKRLNDVNSNNICHHDDTVMVEDPRCLSESTSYAMPSAASLDSGSRSNSNNLLIRDTSTCSSTSVHLTSNVRSPNKTTTLLTTPSSVAAFDSNHYFRTIPPAANTTTTSMNTDCYLNNRETNIGNSNKQTATTNQHTVKFSIPFSKPDNTQFRNSKPLPSKNQHSASKPFPAKSPLSATLPSKLQLCSDTNLSILSNTSHQTSHTNMPPSLNIDGTVGERSIHCSKQTGETASTVFNAHSETSTTSTDFAVNLRKDGSKTDENILHFPKEIMYLQSSTHVGTPSRDCDSGGAVHYAVENKAKMTLNCSGSWQRQACGYPTTTASSDHSCTATTAAVTAVRTSPSNNLTMSTIKQDNPQQQVKIHQEPHSNSSSPSMCIDDSHVSILPASSTGSLVSSDTGISCTSSLSSSSSLSSMVSSTTSSTSSTPSTPSPLTQTSASDVGRRLRIRNQRKFLPEKSRQKRQTLQDMTRPLKQWLYKHRENPYPNKVEKAELVISSHMSLTQVSNWFANARRRLKNTVRGDDVSWARRIKDYNQYAEGNAELFSIPSSEEDNCDTDEENIDERVRSNERTEPHLYTDSVICQSTSPTPTLTSSFMDPSPTSPTAAQSTMTSPSGTTRSSPALDDHQGSHHKYKHSILQRYLQDASQQTHLQEENLVTSRTRHRHLSSSTGSHDFEYLSTSSVSSPSLETHHDSFDEFSEEFETIAIRRRITENPTLHNNDDMYWKEIGAALALTSLARSHSNK